MYAVNRSQTHDKHLQTNPDCCHMLGWAHSKSVWLGHHQRGAAFGQSTKCLQKSCCDVRFAAFVVSHGRVLLIVEGLHFNCGNALTNYMCCLSCGLASIVKLQPLASMPMATAYGRQHHASRFSSNDSLENPMKIQMMASSYTKSSSASTCTKWA